MTDQGKVSRFANSIKEGIGWIDSANISPSWSTMFEEELSDDSIENIIEVLIYSFDIEVK